MPASDYSHLADKIANEVAVPLGNIAVSEGFSGETAQETRRKTVEFLQHAQVLANNVFVLNQILQNTQQGVSHYQETPQLLDDNTMKSVEGNRDATGTVWGRKIKTDAEMRTVQTGNRWIFRDKRWITEVDVSDGKITSCQVAWAGNPGGERQNGDLTGKYTILYPLPRNLATIYDAAKKDIETLAGANKDAASSMPTIEKVKNGGEYGDLQYPNSIFSNLNAPFQTGDFDPDSNFSKLKTNGRTDLENSILADKKEEQRAGEPETETSQAPTTVIQPSSGGFFGGPSSRTTAGFPSSRDRASNRNLRYKLNEVTGDDIYKQLIDKYGGKPGEGISFGSPNSGTGSPLSPTHTLTPYSPSSDKYSTPSQPSYEYTPSKYGPIERTKYDFGTPTSYKSDDLGTATSSYSSGLPDYSTTPSNYITPASSRTGTTIPSSQFNSMMDRLNNPVFTRGASGMPGAPGAASVAGRGGSMSSPGAAPMRENAATYKTGESAAGAQRGTVTGSGGANSGGMGGRGGMGMMPMMPMGGAGAPGAGGKGNKDNKKAQVKNQDGDLYGNDIKSVAPVISAGNKPAGMPQHKETDAKREGMS